MITYSELWSIQEPLLAMAGIAEVWLHWSGGIRRWREATANWWLNLQYLRWRDNVEISGQFYRLFQLIYGRHMFSIHRVLSTIVFSTGFLLAVYTLLISVAQVAGTLPETASFISTPWPWFSGGIYAWKSLSGYGIVVWDSIGFNLIPDFISVVETGWIIRLALIGRYSLPILLIIDISLTTLIWISATVLALALTAIFHSGGTELISIFLEDKMLVMVKILPYVLTTYSTSAIWFCFLVTVLIVAAMKRASVVAARLLESRPISELPILLFFGLPCLLSWPLLFLMRLSFG